MRLARTPALRRATGSSARFQTAAPGRRSADWKFHNDRHQPRAGAATPRQSSPSPPRLPKRPDPTNSTSNRGPNSSPATSSMHAEGALWDGTDAPRLGCAAGVRGARRGRAGGGQHPRPSVRAGTRPRDHLRLAPRERPDPAPTHPSRAVAGRARTQASLLPPPLLLPIFPPRLVDVPVGAASHFAPFVLKQILHPLPLRRQLRLEIIIHCLLSP